MERKTVSIKELRKKFIGRELWYENLVARGYCHSYRDRIIPDFKMPDLEMFRPAPVPVVRDTKPMTEEEIWEWEIQLEIESESCDEILVVERALFRFLIHMKHVKQEMRK